MTTAVTDQSLERVVVRLSELIGQWKTALDDQPANDNGIKEAPYDSAKIRSRFSAEARADGLALAIWVIGDTLGHVGGGRLLNRVFSMVEERSGREYAITLEQRWNGAAGIWCS